MRRGFRLLFLSIVILPSAVIAQPTVGLGGGTGLFFAPNPGDVYAVPVSTTGLVRIAARTPLAITAELSLSLLPYVAVDASFGRSLMALIEARVGATKELASYVDGGLALRLLAGGGLYERRIEGVRAGGVSRRPFISVGPSMAVVVSDWEYEAGARYRLLLDRTPVHSVEPAITVVYRVRARGERE